jgi:hypothetical protein
MIRTDRAIAEWSFSDAFQHIFVLWHSSAGTPYIRRRWCGMPRLTPGITNCCFYLYKTVADAKAGAPFGGTGFLVSVPYKASPTYLHTIGVTNWHVAVRDGYSIARVNTLDGNTDIIELDPSEWIFKPSWHDIAIACLPLSDKKHDVRTVDATLFITKGEFDKLEIGPGEDVFMVGRFVDHDGHATNMPAVRFGNISAMPTAGIVQPTMSKLESYVLDMHSRTGYSGSPVFVYRTFGSHFWQNGKLLAPEPHQFVRLLGIHWGQFPEKWKISPRGRVKAESAKAKRERRFIGEAEIDGLSGMTCAVPCWALTELLENPEMQKMMGVVEDRNRDEIAEAELSPNAENA